MNCILILQYNKHLYFDRKNSFKHVFWRVVSTPNAQIDMSQTLIVLFFLRIILFLNVSLNKRLALVFQASDEHVRGDTRDKNKVKWWRVGSIVDEDPQLDKKCKGVGETKQRIIKSDINVQILLVLLTRLTNVVL